LFCTHSWVLFAQEKVAPLLFNDAIQSANNANIKIKKMRGINLPFADDFSMDSPFPDPNKWQDRSVYINNGFGINMPTIGVATFDNLNQNGHVYNPNGFPITLSADSLTSVEINLGFLQASDSVYLSFLYQPQGNGFKPEPLDSLSLYFKGINNTWSKVWSKSGSSVAPFEHVNIPVTASFFLHSGFQFRFINKASANGNDDHWNLDYVRLDKNRNAGDTLFNEVAFTELPTSILQKYTSMPYKHFKGFEVKEQVLDYKARIINNSTVNRNINIFLQSKANNNATVLKNDTFNVTINGGVQLYASYNMYNFNLPLNGLPNKVRHRFYFPAQGGKDIRSNDTVWQDHNFDQYFAYDDGSAEKSYYLLPASNISAQTALKFTMNVADSVQGLAIRWGSQSPTAEGKNFGIKLYEKLGDSTAQEKVVYQQDFFTVQYPIGQDQFAYYKFDTAQFLPAGDYYIGTVQPTNSGIDTLYFGLDVNTNAAKTKFNYFVETKWKQSEVDGSIMMRPLVGNVSWTPVSITNSAIKEVSAYPNPATTMVTIEGATSDQFTISNSIGQTVLIGKMMNHKIDISALASGNYYLQIPNVKAIKIIKR
jgi:Secretion system C-terminal sorting domain